MTKMPWYHAFFKKSFENTLTKNPVTASVTTGFLTGVSALKGLQHKALAKK